jgi:hypothetical protein
MLFPLVAATNHGLFEPPINGFLLQCNIFCGASDLNPENNEGRRRRGENSTAALSFR